MSGIIVCLTLAATLAGPPVEAAAPASQPAVGAEVRRLIEQLGDADFHIRTAAFKRLKTIGRPAHDQLKAAGENGDDAEIAYRCKQLLAILGSLSTGERCIRAHPAVAKALRKIAATHPDVPAGLAGSTDQQILALVALGRLKVTAEVLDVFEYWATRIKDKTVRERAGYMYASCAVRKEAISVLARHADQRRRLIEFVYIGNSGWTARHPGVPQQGFRVYIAGKLMGFDEAMPLLVRRLMPLRRNAKADLEHLCIWFPLLGSQPAKLHRQLVPVVAAFLDDTRTIAQRPRGGLVRVVQVADHAILALHRMMGKKWGAGLPKVLTLYGAFLFESDAMRKKYIAAFRAWYSKHRDEFGPDPTTRPATRPAAGQ